MSKFQTRYGIALNSGGNEVTRWLKNTGESMKEFDSGSEITDDQEMKTRAQARNAKRATNAPIPPDAKKAIDKLRKAPVYTKWARLIRDARGDKAAVDKLKKQAYLEWEDWISDRAETLFDFSATEKGRLIRWMLDNDFATNSKSARNTAGSSMKQFDDGSEITDDQKMTIRNRRARNAKRNMNAPIPPWAKPIIDAIRRDPKYKALMKAVMDEEDMRKVNKMGDEAEAIIDRYILKQPGLTEAQQAKVGEFIMMADSWF